MKTMKQQSCFGEKIKADLCCETWRLSGDFCKYFPRGKGVYPGRIFIGWGFMKFVLDYRAMVNIFQPP